MKKLFLSADIEGTAGIARWDETNHTKPDYAYFREQMTREVAAVCEAGVAGGAEEILVKDAHASACNIFPGALPECARVFRGWARDPWIMMAGIDNTFDAALYTGYHCGVGCAGNPLAHTMDSQSIRMLLNGEPCSEWLLNAYAAAYAGVPSVFISGDAEVCAQARAYIPDIVTVPVSEGIGNGSIALHPEKAVRRIREGAMEALSAPRGQGFLILPDTFTLDITYREHFMARRNGFYPGAEQTGPQTVSFTSMDYFEVLRFVLFAL